MTITLEINENLNMKPKYHGYNGEFAKINQCTDCGSVGLYEDMHTVNPCPNCGGKVNPHGVGRWNAPKEAKGFFSTQWAEGKWEIRIL